MEVFDPGERFYMDLNAGVCRWMYYNPDAVSGGQYVTNVFGPELIKEAEKANDTFESSFVYEYIESGCRQYLADIGTAEYEAAEAMFKTPADVTGLDYHTLDTIIELFKAKELIDAYCMEEFGHKADFANLSAVGLAYTTTEDDRHEIQVNANLKEHRIETLIDGNCVITQRFESLRFMNDKGLAYLNFDEAVSIPDFVLDDVLYSVSISDLAQRLCFFAEDYETCGVAEYLEEGNTMEDAIESMKEDLRDPKLVYSTLQELKGIVNGDELSGADRAKCYDLMQDLYTLYEEQAMIPYYDMESNIIYGTYNLLNQTCTVTFDQDGVCVEDRSGQYKGEEFYKHLAKDLLPPARCRELMAENFEAYEDIRKLAGHYDVRLGSQKREREDNAR